MEYGHVFEWQIARDNLSWQAYRQLLYPHQMVRPMKNELGVDPE